MWKNFGVWLLRNVVLAVIDEYVNEKQQDQHKQKGTK